METLDKMEQIDSLFNHFEYFGDIIVIDSDDSDNEMFMQIAEELGVKDWVKIFTSGDLAIDHLKSTTNKVGIIFCEIYLPKRTGMELKIAMRENELLKKKSIPFVLFSTVVNPNDVETAYLELPVQGLFLKHGSYQKMKKMVAVALEYWSTCIHPQ